jgi:malonyl-CoA O-methyltransferase
MSLGLQEDPAAWVAMGSVSQGSATVDANQTLHTMTQQPQIASHFDKGAQSYLSAAPLQQQVALQLATALPSQVPVILDLGCGPGWLHPILKQHCQRLWAADLSAAMLAQAQQQGCAERLLQADARTLPIHDETVDLVFSSLMLQWCAEPAAVIDELVRILTPGGRVLLSTLVSGSLAEFSQSWAQVDDQPHQLHFLAAEELMAQLRHPALELVVTEQQHQLYFPDVFSLSRSFKQIGANYVAGRQSGLTGKMRWQRFAKAYEQFRTPQGLPLTYQVLQIQAIKTSNRQR